MSIRRLLCLVGFHKWLPKYTLFNFRNLDGSPYKVAYEIWCFYCKKERDNPLIYR